MENQSVLHFTNPATGKTFGQVKMSTPAEVHQAVLEMRAAAKVWAQKTIYERVRILRKLQQVMLDSLDNITAIMNEDCGKSRQDALIEVFITADMLQKYLKYAPHWLKRQPISTGIYVFKRAYVIPRPYGVVAVVAPWNYPFALSMPPVLGALLAGNTVVLKPSEVTAATGVMIENLFKQVPELAPFVRVVHGDGLVGAALVQAGPDYVFLTGSTGTGKKVMQASGEQLIPAACELGGKDAMIVLEDADIEAAAHWGTWGAFFNTGQTCMSVERVYVMEEVYDEFVRQAVDHTHRLRVGYTKDINSPFYLGPITDPRQLKIIERHLEDALARGARMLTGGRRDGQFFDPIVLVDVDHSMLVMREETFGPIMPIMKVKSEYDAICLANDNSFGLGASIWSRDLERAQHVAHQVEAATILINDTIAQFAIAMLPFGGVKQSGYGRTHGKEGLLQFTQPYSYTYGQPPLPIDLATTARKPGNYRLLAAVTRLLFGATLRQRIQPVAEYIQSQPLPKKEVRERLGIGAAVGVAGALAGAALLTRRRK